MSVAESAGGTREPASPFDRLAACEAPLTEVIAQLEQSGVDGELSVELNAIPPGVRCRACGRRQLPRRLGVLEAYRFEGPSSPEDEAILVVVECPTCRTRGALVSPYGPAAGAEEAEVLVQLGAAYARARGEYGSSDVIPRLGSWPTS